MAFHWANGIDYEKQSAIDHGMIQNVLQHYESHSMVLGMLHLLTSTLTPAVANAIMADYCMRMFDVQLGEVFNLENPSNYRLNALTSQSVHCAQVIVTVRCLKIN